jgi:hypothetical protein
MPLSMLGLSGKLRKMSKEGMSGDYNSGPPAISARKSFVLVSNACGGSLFAPLLEEQRAVRSAEAERI